LSGTTYSNVKQQCARGTNDFQNVYETVKELMAVDKDSQCNDRTGSLFPAVRTYTTEKTSSNMKN